VKCPGLELVLGIADHCPAVAQNQDAMAALAEVGAPFEAQATILGIALNPADEFIPSTESGSDNYVRLSNNAANVPGNCKTRVREEFSLIFDIPNDEY
jgi:hypothetical protein